MRKVLFATAFSAILAAGMASSTVAMAQSPSVLQTIEALKPRPGKSRGSRPVVAPPSSDAGSVAPAAAAPVSAAPVSMAPVSVAPVSVGPAAAAPSARPAVRPAMAAVAPSRPAPTSADADAPSIDISVLFASGSSELQPAAVKSLDTLGQALASPDLSGSRFRIEGHTDTVGTRDENRALSARRAAAVVEFLSHKYKIDGSRLESVGKGQDDLRIPTGDQVAEPRNRRVRVVNITG